MNSRRHESILRNPLIAGTFHRTGAVEIWGRGTNRDIEECERWGVEPPSFEVVTGSLWDDPRQAAQLEATLPDHGRRPPRPRSSRGPG